MFVRWRDKQNGFAWFVRRMSADGKFFGDITDTNGMQQRNFTGELDHKTLDAIFKLCESIKLMRNDGVIQEHSVFFAAIGRQVNEFDFQGRWTRPDDVPDDVLRLVRLINPCILDSLILAQSDSLDRWSILLKQV